jgi:hypothetical protein
LEIFYSKKIQESTGLNMVNANFTDINDEKYSLTTQGLIF